jgi:hypothetical protein
MQLPQEQRRETIELLGREVMIPRVPRAPNGVPGGRTPGKHCGASDRRSHSHAAPSQRVGANDWLRVPRPPEAGLECWLLIAHSTTSGLIGRLRIRLPVAW